MIGGERKCQSCTETQQPIPFSSQLTDRWKRIFHATILSRSVGQQAAGNYSDAKPESRHGYRSTSGSSSLCCHHCDLGDCTVETEACQHLHVNSSSIHRKVTQISQRKSERYTKDNYLKIYKMVQTEMFNLKIALHRLAYANAIMSTK